MISKTTKAKTVIKQLNLLANKEKAIILSKFFKTGKGQYGEGDKFLGITVDKQRIVAKTHQNLPLKEIEKIIKSPFHEHRLTALLILTYKFPKINLEEQKKSINFYLKNTKHINNWDLVDLSAPKILGQYVLENPKQKTLIQTLSKSKNLWEKRISVLATYPLIKNGDFAQTFKVSEILLNDDHDLIHKAVGWMLREVGKINEKEEEHFLNKHYRTMPRTMLRYAIEKFPEIKRLSYLKK